MAEASNESTKEAVRGLLGCCNTLSLATCDDNIPWAASVFFVADQSLALYFISAKSSRHSLNADSNPRVAATVNGEHSDWLEISGLQLEGALSLAPASQRERILGLYLSKFPQVAQLREQPRNEQEKLIAERLLSSDFYQLIPRTIRLIDNSRGFGFKQELRLVE